MGQSFWDTVNINDFLNVDTVRYCPSCMLVYKPDPRQHIKPNLYCPRDGYKLVKDVKDEFEEHRQPGGGTDGGSGAKFY